MADGRIDIAAGEAGERSDLRRLVSDQLQDVSSQALLDRVAQYNKRAVDLINEYVSRFEQNTPDADLLLYSAGVKISSVMGSLLNPTYEDERPPQEFLDGLKSLLILHESYIWSVPRIREVIELRRKALDSYSPSTKSPADPQLDLLTRLSLADYLVGERARQTIQDFTGPLKIAAPDAIGPEALQHGVLRGALQFMGRAIVNSAKEVIKIGKGAAIRVVAETILGSAIYLSITKFFSDNLGKIIQLAHSAQEWNWLHYVVQLLGLASK